MSFRPPDASLCYKREKEKQQKEMTQIPVLLHMLWIKSIYNLAPRPHPVPRGRGRSGFGINQFVHNRDNGKYFGLVKSVSGYLERRKK